MSQLVSADEIAAAYEQVVRDRVRHTPVISSASITQRAGCTSLFLKQENQQRTGSFKIRGATFRISQLTDTERARGVVTASAGNHAQGVALASYDAGIASTVFMPETASIAKIQATASFGATVVLEGANFDEAVSAARRHEEKTGAVFVSAYDDDGVITGQGSLGIELLEDLPDIDTVVIPIGGGGLFAGVATALKERRPSVRVIGVQAAGADGAARSFRAGALIARQEPVATIADGIAIKAPSPRTFQYIQRYADDVVTVREDSLADAIMLLLSRAKVVVEPAGAAGLAALMEHPGLGVGKTAAILCGGNIDLKLLADLIERSMIRAHRYFHFFTTCADKPGGLARLLDVIASVGANVMEVVHNRISPEVAYGQTGVEMLVEVRDENHIDRLTSLLTEKGYPVDRLD